MRAGEAASIAASSAMCRQKRRSSTGWARRRRLASRAASPGEIRTGSRPAEPSINRSPTTRGTDAPRLSPARGLPRQPLSLSGLARTFGRIVSRSSPPGSTFSLFSRGQSSYRHAQISPTIPSSRDDALLRQLGPTYHDHLLPSLYSRPLKGSASHGRHRRPARRGRTRKPHAAQCQLRERYGSKN